MGLISKRKTFSLHHEEASAEGEDSEKALNELDAALDTLEERVKDREEASAERNPVEKAAPLEVGEEEKGKEVPFSGKKSFREEEISSSGEKRGPPIFPRSALPWKMVWQSGFWKVSLF